jgi:hypothetical protein
MPSPQTTLPPNTRPPAPLPPPQALIKVLRRALDSGASSAAAWIALSELQLEAGEAQGALEAARAGLRYVIARHQAGKENLKQAVLMLHLLSARVRHRAACCGPAAALGLLLCLLPVCCGPAAALGLLLCLLPVCCGPDAALGLLLCLLPVCCGVLVPVRVASALMPLSGLLLLHV